MENSEIFEKLAEIECELFHKWADTSKDDPEYETVKEAHRAAREAFEAFAKVLGLTK